jgi:hypothetical protein
MMGTGRAVLESQGGSGFTALPVPEHLFFYPEIQGNLGEIWDPLVPKSGTECMHEVTNLPQRVPML